MLANIYTILQNKGRKIPLLEIVECCNIYLNIYSYSHFDYVCSLPPTPARLHMQQTWRKESYQRINIGETKVMHACLFFF